MSEVTRLGTCRVSAFCTEQYAWSVTDHAVHAAEGGTTIEEHQETPTAKIGAMTADKSTSLESTIHTFVDISYM
jgi:hypothetical protein